MLVETGNASGGTRTTQGEVQRADVIEPSKAIRSLPADQGMLKQGEQRNRCELLGGGGHKAEEKRSRRSMRQRCSCAVVGRNVPAEQES